MKKIQFSINLMNCFPRIITYLHVKRRRSGVLNIANFVKENAKNQWTTIMIATVVVHSITSWRLIRHTSQTKTEHHRYSPVTKSRMKTSLSLMALKTPSAT